MENDRKIKKINKNPFNFKHYFNKVCNIICGKLENTIITYIPSINLMGGGGWDRHMDKF